MKILVLESNPMDCEVLCKIMERLGHNAFGVNDGDEALARLKKEVFDLVTTNIRISLSPMVILQNKEPIEGNKAEIFLRIVGRKHPRAKKMIITGHAVYQPPENLVDEILYRPFSIKAMEEFLQKVS